MIYDKLMQGYLQYTADTVKKAVAIIDGAEHPVRILRKDIIPEKNRLKIYTVSSQGKGTLTDMILLDENDNKLISQPRNVEKSTPYGIISTFLLQIEEKELDELEIFDEHLKIPKTKGEEITPKQWREEKELI